MAGPLARIVAQLIVQGASIFTRAFFTAYQQALRNAKSGGHASTATAVVRKKMAADEAAKILNVEMGAGKDVVEKQYKKYFDLNDPAKGGSFYLQSKIFRAREAMINEAFEAADTRKEDSKGKRKP